MADRNRNENVCAGALLRSLLVVAALTVTGSVVSAQVLDGQWEGSLLVNDATLRVIVDVSTTDDEVHLATLTSPDQGGTQLAVDVMKLDDDTVTFEIRAIGATFMGRLDEATNTIIGAWDQGVTLPLNLTRTSDPRAERARAGERAAPVQAAPEPFGAQLHVDTPFVPPAFAADGALHLAWELHLTNFGVNPLAIRRIEVLGVAGDRESEREEQLLARFERAELNALLRPVSGASPDPGTTGRAADLRVLAPGRRAVAYLWLRVEDHEALPQRLIHRVTVRDQEFRVADVQVSRAEFAPLSAPLSGSGWLAVNGPGNASVHRRGLLTVEGRARIAQRFAADWVRIDEEGRTFAGDPELNSSYFAYGEQVLAVADSTVVAVRDDLPENVPGMMSRAVPVTLDTLAGNFVVLDLHDGRYATYAHLQPGSIAVQQGQRVQRGELLGRVGNSGNSTEPHLHFHVADSPTLAGEGIPYTFERFVLHHSDGPPEPRQDELPLHNMLVSFPDRR